MLYEFEKLDVFLPPLLAHEESTNLVLKPGGLKIMFIRNKRHLFSF